MAFSPAQKQRKQQSVPINKHVNIILLDDNWPLVDIFMSQQRALCVFQSNKDGIRYVSLQKRKRKKGQSIMAQEKRKRLDERRVIELLGDHKLECEMSRKST